MAKRGQRAVGGHRRDRRGDGLAELAALERVDPELGVGRVGVGHGDELAVGLGHHVGDGHVGLDQRVGLAVGHRGDGLGGLRIALDRQPGLALALELRVEILEQLLVDPSGLHGDGLAGQVVGRGDRRRVRRGDDESRPGLEERGGIGHRGACVADVQAGPQHVAALGLQAGHQPVERRDLELRLQAPVLGQGLGAVGVEADDVAVGPVGVVLERGVLRVDAERHLAVAQQTGGRHHRRRCAARRAPGCGGRRACWRRRGRVRRGRRGARWARRSSTTSSPSHTPRGAVPRR